MKRSLCVLLLFTTGIACFAIDAPEEYEPPLHPIFQSQSKDTHGHDMWQNPACLIDSRGIEFHFRSNVGVYTALQSFRALLTGEYDIIAFWIDQFSEGGYGTGLCFDISVAGTFWAAGGNTFVDFFVKGPSFLNVSHGAMTWTSTLYFAATLPIRISEIDIGIGISLVPLYRLKVPLNTQFFSQLYQNIISLAGDELDKYFQGLDLFKGLGFQLNAGLLVAYGDFDVGVLISDITSSRIYYERHHLADVIDNISSLFQLNGYPIDHVGVIPPDISLCTSHTWNIDSTIVPFVELQGGVNDIIAAFSNLSQFLTHISLAAAVHFSSFFSIQAAVHHGAALLDFALSLSWFRMTTGFSQALSDSIVYPYPAKSFHVQVDVIL